jgi:hypothetical protein
MADCTNCQKLTERLLLERKTHHAVLRQCDVYAIELAKMRGALRGLIERSTLTADGKKSIAERFL